MNGFGVEGALGAFGAGDAGAVMLKDEASTSPSREAEQNGHVLGNTPDVACRTLPH